MLGLPSWVLVWVKHGMKEQNRAADARRCSRFDRATPASAAFQCTRQAPVTDALYGVTWRAATRPPGHTLYPGGPRCGANGSRDHGD